ncbi:MAG TPA: serine hydrolase [Mycobacteriales bacterium]|jgi:D-alanyl-D-alanine carboxypeptidase (penicillin-binding protein 5/6)
MSLGGRLAVYAGVLALLIPALAVPAAAAPGAAQRPSTVGGPLLASRGVVAPKHAPALPDDITAKGWVVADANTGAVLAARDPHGKYLPASTLKTLTALTLLPRLTNRQQIVEITDADVNVDGTRVGIVEHGRIKVETLFECMLMMSGNDCANALARTAGSVPSTLKLMDATAHKIGALDTHAGTPSGLDAPGEHTSAYDLALILRADLKIPDFQHYNHRLFGVIPKQPPHYKSIGFANDNLLLANHYPGLLAAKNGYTDAAHQEFVAAAQQHGRRLIVTFMHGERYPVEMWKQVAQLFDWGFKLPQGVAPVGQLVTPRPPATHRVHATPTPSAAPTRVATRAAASTGGTDGSTGWIEPLAIGVGLVLAAAVLVGLLLRRRRTG